MNIICEKDISVKSFIKNPIWHVIAFEAVLSLKSYLLRYKGKLEI